MRFAPALAALAVLAALAGCSPNSTEPEPPPPGRGWAQPIVAIESEEEALAAATRLYEAYVESGESIVNAGGSQPELVRPFVSGRWFEQLQASYNSLNASGNRSTGNSTMVDMRVQRWAADEVTAYACRDYSNVRLLDGRGVDITPPDRPRFGTFEVVFISEDGRFVIDDDTLWSRGQSCF